MGGLFGSKQSTASIPGWLEDAATEMLDRSVSLGKTGYMPWSGPDVAALTPDQLAARENTNRAASAFGMSVGGLGTPGATDFGNGIWGHSSLPLYNQQMDWMRENRPGQLDYYNSHFIDPVTGAPSMYDQSTAMADNRTPMEIAMANGTTSTAHPAVWGFMGTHSGGGGGAEAGDFMSPMQGPQQPSGGLLGGYTGIGDMFNGGGPGASGPTYQGGGLISDIGNARNAVTGRSAKDGLFGGWF